MDQITYSTMLMQINCNFPFFTNQVLEDYYMHWKKHINPIVFIPTVFVYAALLIGQAGLIGLANSNGDMTTYMVRLIAVLSIFVCYFFFGLYCIFHFLRITGRDYKAFKARLKKWFTFRMEDAMVVTGVCAWSLFLIARMLAGECPSGTSLWQEQTCNPYANRGGIPAGMVSTLYSLPLVAQLLMRCISIRVLFLCYILSFVAVLFCVFFTNSSYHSSYPELVIIALFINSSFEVTRLQRLSYVDTLKSKEQEQMAIEQVKKEQKMQEVVQQLELERAEERRVVQQLQLDRAEDEKRLKEAEVFQLRSLIGNVVHDLKTPLFAIEADLDMLKMYYSFLPEDAIHDAIGLMHHEFNLVRMLPYIRMYSPVLCYLPCFDFSFVCLIIVHVHRIAVRMALNLLSFSRPCGPPFVSW